MIIRCDRCSTLYELDESLLAPGGSQVQCTRCQTVFTAYPQKERAQEGAPPPAPEQPPAAPLPTPQVAPAASASHHTRLPPGHTGPSVYRPPISQPSVSRPPVIRRNAVGTFESRLRWRRRWRWLAPAMFAGAVVIAAMVFLARDTIGGMRTRSELRSAMELAYRDDLSSLETARARLDEVLRTAPRLAEARADRALIDLLVAGRLIEQAQDRGGAEELKRKGQALAADAAKTLEEMEKSGIARGEVARARAVGAALGSDRAQLMRVTTAARGHLGEDPLVETAERAVDVRSTDRTLRERALDALPLFIRRHPGVLRARLVLARGQALAGRRPEALATLDALLGLNPAHEGAATLRTALSRPPSSAPIPSAAAPVPPEPQAPARAARASPPAASPAAAPSEQPEPQIEPQPAAARVEKPVTVPRKRDSSGGENPGTSTGSTPPPPLRGEEPSGLPPMPDGHAADAEHAPGEAEVPVAAPRLRPAAVPEPEPVQGGG